MEKKIQFTTTFKKELLEGLKIEAVKKGCNVNEILEDLIKNYLGSCNEVLKKKNVNLCNVCGAEIGEGITTCIKCRTAEK